MTTARHGERAQGRARGFSRALASAFAVLQRELRGETRAMREARDRLSEAVAALEGGLARWLRHQEALTRQLDERGLGAAEQALFSIADRLDVILRHGVLQPLPLLSMPSRLPWRWAKRTRERLLAVEEGLRLAQAELEDHLTALGIHRLPTIGRAFDPATMDIVDHVTRPELAEGTVVDERAAGYRRGDRILRPARVVVASSA
jgi:hypothetical protein